MTKKKDKRNKIERPHRMMVIDYLSSKKKKKDYLEGRSRRDTPTLLGRIKSEEKGHPLFPLFLLAFHNHTHIFTHTHTYKTIHVHVA